MKTLKVFALLALVITSRAISQEKRAMGWKPDVGGVVDKAFGPRFRGVTIKESVDLRAKMPPVYDQGAIGSCVSQGVGVALDYAHVKSNPGMKFFTPSRLFIYYQGRVAIGTVNQDSGCQIRDAIAATQKLGAPLESLWPYRESRFKIKPPAAAYSDALKHQIIQAYKAETLDDVKTALSLDLPVIFGVPVCLLEPVHPDYYPGRAAFTHDWPIPDPSNAPAGMPARSPHGFPLWYPLDPAGAACGAPRVTWGGLMFANDEDVERTIRKAIGAGGFGPVGRFRRPDGRM